MPLVSFKPAKARYNSVVEQLKQRLRNYLRRDLTPREEQLVELSAPMLDSQDSEEEPTDEEEPAA